MADRLMEVSYIDFGQKVLRSEKPVLVVFGADWSHHFKKLAPILEDIADRHFEDLSIVTLDVDRDRSVALCYHIETVPSFILFKGGDPVERRTGSMPEAEIENWIGSSN